MRSGAALVWALGVLLGLAAPAHAQSAGSSNVKATANVRVMRPLQLTALRNLNFGTIVMGTVTTDQVVTVASTGRACGSGGQLTCTGTFATAQYRVVGTNNQVVSITSSSPTFSLTNATGARLQLTPIMPSSIVIPNSGNQGATFEVGGRFTIGPTTPDGVYSGTIDIQVAYQ